MSDLTALAVVRIRGHVKVNVRIEKTMRMLRLTRVNHCVIIPSTKYYLGMLQKAKDYITWGEIDKETMIRLITEKGRLTGEKPIDDAYIKNKTKYPGIDALAGAILRCEFTYKEVPGVKPVFRLHPPKGGYRTIKRSAAIGGTLGYRGKGINTLIHRCLDAEKLKEKVKKDA